MGSVTHTPLSQKKILGKHIYRLDSQWHVRTKNIAYLLVEYPQTKTLNCVLLNFMILPLLLPVFVIICFLLFNYVVIVLILLLSHFIMVLLNFHHLVTCFFCLINHVSSCVSPIFMTVFFFHVFIILPNFSHPFSSFRYCLKGVCTFHHYHFLIIFHHIAMFLLLFSYFIIFSSSLIISSLFSTWFCDRPHFSHQLSASCQCH